MKVLGFDCAGFGCAAAVLDGDRVAASRALSMARGQSEKLVPLIGEVLAEAGIKPDALDLVSVTTGPGGFTGIRIGLAAARGLALATGKPVVGVSTFDVFAASVPKASRANRTLLVAVESKRDEFYLQAFADGVAGEPTMLHPRDLGGFLPSGPLMLAGDAAARLVLLLPCRDVTVAREAEMIDPVQVALLGAAALKAGQDAPARPLYLRPPDTTMPAKNFPGTVAGPAA